MSSNLGLYPITIVVDATELRQGCKTENDFKTAVSDYLLEYFKDGMAEECAESIVAQYKGEGLWK